MKKKLSIILIFVVISAVVHTINLQGSNSLSGDENLFKSEASQLMAGASVRNITPTPEMFPLTRMPQVEMVGVLDSIHVRVLAISSEGVTSLLVCSETGHGLTPQGAEELARHTGLPVGAIFSTATHSHATPENGGKALHPNGPEVANQKVWEEYAFKKTLEAADEALSRLEPAEVGIGYSQSYINVNRLSKYNKIAEDGTVTEYFDLGYNPAGPSDKEVVAMRFNDSDGNPIAFIINYAVHGTVMHANKCIDGKTGVSADIPGLVSGYLEEKYDGSVAVWTSGAAGDQNPIVQNDIYTRNPLTGEFEEIFSNSYDILTYVSKIHFADIENALSSIDGYTGKVNVKNGYKESSIPGTSGEDFKISLQMLRIGDIGLFGYAGEPFTSIGMYMKQNSKLKNTVVVVHSLGLNRGYQADDESIAHGGFGTNARYKPGYLKEAMTDLMNSLIDEANLAE